MYRNVRIELLKVIFVLILFLGFIIPERIFAQIVINEFVPNGSPEWVEFYNSSESAEYIKEYYIDDDLSFADDTGSASKKILSSLNTSNPTYPYFEISSSLFNNSGDFVVIFDQSGSIIDQYQYTLDPGKDISIGRYPDNNGGFGVLPFLTKGDGNPAFATSTPASTSEPVSVKSLYKINKPKDKSGSELTSVQIYVDGVYTHHLDDEILEFFNGHECYSGVECSLGIHTISLRKTGYTSWEDTQNFSSGMNLEVNPVLEALETDSPTPTVSPTVSLTSVLGKTSSPSAQANTTVSGTLNLPDILGLSKSPNPNDTQDTLEGSEKMPIFPIVVIVLGIGFISIAIFSIIKNSKKDYTGESEKQSSEIY
jgi:hypothetical protein